MKKILLIGPILENLTGFRKELVQTLLEEGYDVTFATSFSQDETKRVDERVHLINVNIDRRGSSIIADLKLSKKYLNVLRDLKPDCVLTFTTKCSVYGGIACTIMRVPYIVNNSGLYNPDDFGKLKWFILNSLYKLGYSHARCLMHQNKYEQQYLDKKTRNRPKSILLPGSGVNLDAYAYCPYPEENGKVILNYLARIVNIKGIFELLEAAKVLKPIYPEMEIRIYGSFESQSYKQVVEKAEIEGLVKYCGKTNNVPYAIKSCHGLVHPSYYEGMSNVILEHSAMGRPCLGSDIPGVREGIEDGVTGFIFKTKDVESLISAIKKFMSLSYEEKKQMGIRAHEKMAREFDRKLVVESYMSEIHRIINKLK